MSDDAQPPPRYGRERLPNRRRHETGEAPFGADGRVHTVSVGFYGDGRAGEVFIEAAKSGSYHQAVLDDVGIILSHALQHGATLAAIAASLGHTADGRRTSALGAVADLAVAIEREAA